MLKYKMGEYSIVEKKQVNNNMVIRLPMKKMQKLIKSKKWRRRSYFPKDRGHSASENSCGDLSIFFSTLFGDSFLSLVTDHF